MTASLTIERLPSAAVSPDLTSRLHALCDAAYGTQTEPFFASLGGGDHLLGLVDGELVSHLMWVTRWLEPEGAPRLRTAYVEMVATAPSQQRRGYASALLAAVPPLLSDYDIAALCPATENLYLRLGWRFWRGPLAHRKDGRLIPDRDERVMVLGLPRTPPLDMSAALSVEWRPGEVW